MTQNKEISPEGLVFYANPPGRQMRKRSVYKPFADKLHQHPNEWAMVHVAATQYEANKWRVGLSRYDLKVSQRAQTDGSIAIWAAHLKDTPSVEEESVNVRELRRHSTLLGGFAVSQKPLVTKVTKY